MNIQSEIQKDIENEERERKIIATIVVVIFGILLIATTIWYYHNVREYHNNNPLETKWFYVDLFFPLIFMLWMIYMIRRYKAIIKPINTDANDTIK